MKFYIYTAFICFFIIGCEKKQPSEQELLSQFANSKIEVKERVLAGEQLEELKASSEAITDAFIAALKDERMEIKHVAIKQLVRIASKKAVDALISIIDSEHHPKLRDSLIYGLGSLGEKAITAIPALTKNITKASLGDKQTVARALGDIGTIETVAPLVSMIRGESYSDAAVMIEALTKIGQKNPPFILNALQQEKDSYAKKYLARVIAKLPSSEKNIAVLMKSDRETRDDVLPQLTKTLIQENTPQSISILVSMVMDRSIPYNLEKDVVDHLVKSGEKAQQPILKRLSETKGFPNFQLLTVLAQMPTTKETVSTLEMLKKNLEGNIPPDDFKRFTDIADKIMAKK